MSRVLEELNPSRVFYYFEEISKIPRGSGNTRGISEYCVRFATEHGLKYREDGLGNVVIYKKATLGRELDGGVILQGHLDMVIEKKAGITHDFLSNGLNLVVDGDFVYANGTTLGGDDGIAVAYALAILEDDTISHPELEIVLTVDEEIGLLGAAAIDLSDVKSKYMINLDSEEDSVLWAGCAGGMTSTIQLPLKKESFIGYKAEITVAGLKGGHSGAEIDKERANANIILGRVLHSLKHICLFSLCDISGGQKDNAIPREAKASILLDINDQYFVDTNLIGETPEAYEDKKFYEIENEIEKLNLALKEEYETSDPNIMVSILIGEERHMETYNMLDSEKIVFLLSILPNGVQNMSTNIVGLVETSLNLGIMKIEEDTLITNFSVRSSVESRKKELGNKLKYIAEFLGADYSYMGDYPGWNFKKDSVLRNIMSATYYQMFGKNPEVKAIHAGLECGYFIKKCPHLDIVSFGPNIYDIHTTEERLSISSTKYMYEFLIEVLKEIK